MTKVIICPNLPSVHDNYIIAYTLYDINGMKKFTKDSKLGKFRIFLSDF